MRIFGSAIALLLAAGLAAGDEVELANGDVITDCKVTDLGDSYRIVKGAISRTVLKTEVSRVEYKETSEDVYKKRAAAVKDDDLAGHLSLARFCRDRGLTAPAAEEFRKVIALNPDHEEARAALGYQKHEGKWMTEDEVSAARGLVRHKGRWVTPQERDLDIALDEQRELDRKIVAEVRRALDHMATPDEKKRDEAAEQIGKFEDRYKVKPYLSALTSSNRHVRLFVARELGRVKADLGDSAWSATKALARRAAWDESEPVRTAAVRSLVAIGHADAALSLTAYLDEEAWAVRIRVEDAVGYFKDLRAVPPLLQQLAATIDTLRFIERYEKEIAQIVRNTIITRDGRRIPVPPNIKFSPEALFDRETKRRVDEEKQSLVAALRAVTGQDFGDDVLKWRDWHEKKKAEKDKPAKPPEK